MSEIRRQHQRHGLSLAVSYRSTGSFLLAYTINLSKGGLFIDAPPQPVGTTLSLALEVPGVGQLLVNGVVAWVRAEPGPSGEPAGMGVRFTQAIDDALGEHIDRLTASFAGMSILIMSTRAERRGQLVRSLRSIVSCECVEAEWPDAAQKSLEKGVDLMVVDLDSVGIEGVEVLRMARTLFPTVPAIAVSADDARREWALEIGATRALPSPTPHPDLHAAVLGSLIRPILKAKK